AAHGPPFCRPRDAVLGRGGVKRGRAAAVVVAGGLAVGAGAPLVASIQPIRRALTPALLPARLSGVSTRHHVALTFDDGPDPVSTPAFLELLEARNVRATFFLLGRYVGEAPELVRRMADAGHELGVHGWTHRCVARPGARRLREDLRLTKWVVEQASGRPVAFYRPPYGVLTTHALVGARAAGLSTVLWSDWG